MAPLHASRRAAHPTANRPHEPQRIVGDLLSAEIAAKQARSIKYQIPIAKLPLAKDTDDFHFAGTPINETLVRDLAGGNFLAHQRNVVLVGGTGTGKTHLAIAIARACIRDGARGRFFNVVIPINRIMKAATNLLLHLARRTDTQRRLRDLALVYDTVSPVPPQSLRWDAVVVDRTNSRWRHLLTFARLLLERRFQTTTAGASPGFSLLFEMNELFEAYIGRLVVRAFAGTPMDVVLQGGRLHCLTEADSGRGAFRTRPDVLIRRNGVVTQVIDTKWKRISARIDDPRQGVSKADIYQMLVYGHVYQTARLTLLYPHTLALGEREGVQGSYQVTGQEMALQTASFDVGDGTRAAERLRLMLEPTVPAGQLRVFG